MRKSVALLALALVGCNSGRGNEQIRSLEGADAVKMNSGRTQFDTSEDPPINADTHFAAGNFAEDQGRLDMAIQQYAKAIEADHKHVKALYRLGVVYSKQRKFDKAVEVFKRYVAADDGSAEAWGNLAFAHEMAGQPGEATSAYLAGIAKDPQNKGCRTNYGLMLARAGQVDQGRAQLARVLTPAQVEYALGTAYEKLGRNDLALAQYKKSVAIDKEFAPARERAAKLQGSVSTTQ